MKLEAGEELLLSFPSMVKKKEGIIHITNCRLAWTVGKTDEILISLPFNSIKSQSINAATSAKIMLRVVIVGQPHKKEQFRTFTFTSNNPVSDREEVKNALAAALQKIYQKHQNSAVLNENPHLNETLNENKTLLTTKEIQIRQDILKNHKDLMKLHMELVLNGLLSEEEFWNIRQNLLENEKFVQKKGQASSSLADIRPTHNEGNDIKYTITTEIIHSIFMHYPSIKKAYDENVPKKINENEFWKRYFSSKFFHSNRTQGKSHIDTKDPIFDKCLEEDKFTGPSQEEIENIPLLIDLTTTEQNQFEGYGTKPDFTMRGGSAKSSSMQLIRKFNHHSEIILNSLHTINKEDKIEMDNEIKKNLVFDDLTTKKEEIQTPLKIKDQKRYFESQVSLTNQSLEKKILTREEFKEYLENFKTWHLHLNNVNNSKTYAISEKVFNKLNNNVITYNQDKLSQLNRDLNDLPISVQQEINTYQLVYNELLKHFWFYIPITSDDNKQTVDRLVSILKNTEERFNEFHTKLTNEYHNKALSSKELFNSLSKSIKRAYQVYNDQVESYNNKRAKIQ
ncbi:hypothetical protein BCR32DRAFT_268030 [Anaeromyces robustus]|uniref:BSD domain-containing protein n=1 Tax=Anaeromyces robustus TaxID=1754192 RepID=A0A1Y1X7Y1_9FUNG|nr:hypothetical protein BCR32DRAFT_268030 [Anaeromyces robustus]|eukprot:ORX81862.1 hypothetical protein BCR32DRAFT_268030 [Anaeromyces robustus]